MTESSVLVRDGVCSKEHDTWDGAPCLESVEQAHPSVFTTVVVAPNVLFPLLVHSVIELLEGLAEAFEDLVVSVGVAIECDSAPAAVRSWTEQGANLAVDVLVLLCADWQFVFTAQTLRLVEDFTEFLPDLRTPCHFPCRGHFLAGNNLDLNGADLLAFDPSRAGAVRNTIFILSFFFGVLKLLANPGACSVTIEPTL